MRRSATVVTLNERAIIGRYTFPRDPSRLFNVTRKEKFLSILIRFYRAVLQSFKFLRHGDRAYIRKRTRGRNLRARVPSLSAIKCITTHVREEGVAAIIQRDCEV